MTEGQARDAINGAALVVAGVYFYRKLIEPQQTTKGKKQPSSISGAAGQLIGVGPLASTGRFIVGFGFVFLVLSLAEGASPALAGNFAILVALGAVLGNGVQVTKDLQTQLNEKQSTLRKASLASEAEPATVQKVSWEAIYPGTTRRKVSV